MTLIKCEECGQMISENATECPNCGCPVEKRIVHEESEQAVSEYADSLRALEEKKQCKRCGYQFDVKDNFCPKCGQNYYSDSDSSLQRVIFIGTDYGNKGTCGKSRLLFCFLGLIFGLLGVHLFYIGRVRAGLLNLLIFFLGLVFAIFLGISINNDYDIYGAILFVAFLLVLWLIAIIAIAIIYLYQLVRVALMTQEEFERIYVYGDKFYPI